MTPVKVDAIDQAFGGKIDKLLPTYASIPDEFKRHNGNKWVDVVETWFFEGLDPKRLIPEPHIDKRDALGHLRAIMCSFEPKHEHKIAGVAYLMSMWFAEVRS